jgi:hypothetical protein
MPPKTATAAEAGEVKKARKGLAVGDHIFDFELETEESTREQPKTASISVRGGPHHLQTGSNAAV